MVASYIHHLSYFFAYQPFLIIFLIFILICEQNSMPSSDNTSVSQTPSQKLMHKFSRYASTTVTSTRAANDDRSSCDDSAFSSSITESVKSTQLKFSFADLEPSYTTSSLSFQPDLLTTQPSLSFQSYQPTPQGLTNFETSSLLYSNMLRLLVDTDGMVRVP